MDATDTALAIALVHAHGVCARESSSYWMYMNSHGRDIMGYSFNTVLIFFFSKPVFRLLHAFHKRSLERVEISLRHHRQPLPLALQPAWTLLWYDKFKYYGQRHQTIYF